MDRISSTVDNLTCASKKQESSFQFLPSSLSFPFPFPFPFPFLSLSFPPFFSTPLPSISPFLPVFSISTLTSTALHSLQHKRPQRHRGPPTPPDLLFRLQSVQAEAALPSLRLSLLPAQSGRAAVGRHRRDSLECRVGGRRSAEVGHLAVGPPLFLSRSVSRSLALASFLFLYLSIIILLLHLTFLSHATLSLIRSLSGSTTSGWASRIWVELVTSTRASSSGSTTRPSGISSSAGRRRTTGMWPRRRSTRRRGKMTSLSPDPLPLPPAPPPTGPSSAISCRICSTSSPR